MYKPGQKVKVTTPKGDVVEAKFVAEHPGDKGSYLEVTHLEGKTKRYRPAKVAAA